MHYGRKHTQSRHSGFDPGSEDVFSSGQGIHQVCMGVYQARHDEETLSLDDALHRLEERDRRVAEVVRLRFYAALSIDETAQALEISPATVKRRWEFGRTWLFRELDMGPER